MMAVSLFSSDSKGKVLAGVSGFWVDGNCAVELRAAQLDKIDRLSKGDDF
jgi:hypothetical protein